MLIWAADQETVEAVAWVAAGKRTHNPCSVALIMNLLCVLRLASPRRRSGGGGGCSPSNACQQHDDGDDDRYEPKLLARCECLGGGQDCQRCGRKVYQAEMQVG